MAQQQNQLAVQEQFRNLQGYLQQRQKAFSDLLPKHMTAERMVKGLLATARRNPRVLECTQESVLNCMIICSSLGLEPGRPQGGMHLVPFKNKGRYELTPIPDYRGLIDLAYRSGMVDRIEARDVRSADTFDMAYGTDSHITHKPAVGKDRGNLIGVYAVCHIKGADQSVFVWLSLQECHQFRDKSRGYQYAIQNGRTDTPWLTDETAMCLKTAVRRLATWIPQAAEQWSAFQNAVALEDRVDRGEGVSDLFENIIEGEAVEVHGEEDSGGEQGGDAPTSNTGAVMGALGDGGQQQPESKPRGRPKGKKPAASKAEEQPAEAAGEQEQGDSQEAPPAQEEPAAPQAPAMPPVESLANPLEGKAAGTAMDAEPFRSWVTGFSSCGDKARLDQLIEYFLKDNVTVDAGQLQTIVDVAKKAKWRIEGSAGQGA